MAHWKGDHELARELMSSIASPERPGYPAAHLWLAKDLMSNAPFDVSKLRQVEQHLALTVRDQPANATAHGMLAEVYLLSGKHQLAIEHLEKASKTISSLRLTLARVCRLQGYEERAERETNRLIAECRDNLVEAPTDDRTRVLLADALLFAARPEEAEVTLRQGYALSRDPRYKRALTELYIGWSDALLDSKDDEKCVRLLVQALEHSPESDAAVVRLATFAILPSVAGQSARDALQHVEIAGRGGAIVQLQLGTEAAVRGDYQTAISYLEHAYILNPTMPEIVNNLAWLLAIMEPPDLERAFRLSSDAVRLSPTNAEFRETRGQVLIKLGRWKEAIHDLEQALRTRHESTSLHQGLAIAYDRIGDSELADLHRRLSKGGTNP